MRAGSLALLGIVTAAAVAAAVSLSTVRHGVGASADRGAVFFPELLTKVADVSQIEIQTGERTTILRRDGERFIDESGYPARLSAVRDLLTQLSVLSVEEAKTDRPERYGELSLAAPDAEDGASKRIRLLAGDQAVADVYIGKKEASVGGTRGGLYARRDGEAVSWLLRGAIDLPGSRAGWFANRLLEFKEDQLSAIALTSTAGSARFARDGDGPLSLQDVPDGREADVAKVGALVRSLDGLAFADVRKSAGGEATGPSMNVQTRDGIDLTITEVQVSDDKKVRWVRMTVQGGDGSDNETLAALRQRLEGFDFELRGRDAELLGSAPDSFLKL